MICKKTIDCNDLIVKIKNNYFHKKCYLMLEFPHSPFYEWGKY